MEQFIVEILTSPEGVPFKRSLPKTQEEADALVVRLSAAKIATRIVPAEKYAFKGIQQRVDKPEETAPNEYRSRVE